MSAGDLTAYDIYMNYCKNANVDTVFKTSDLKKTNSKQASFYTIIKTDKCQEHKICETFRIKDNELVTSYELYNDDTVFIVHVDSIAQFYLNYEENNKYQMSYTMKPETLEKSKGGTVYLTMLILKNGEIECLEILRNGSDKFVNSEGLRYVGNMPTWMPAMKNGKRVTSRVNYPFRINID